MDKNFYYFNNLFKNLNSRYDIDINIFKNVFLNYFNNLSLDDKNFLKSLDFSNLKICKTDFSKFFDYNKYINLDLTHASVLIFVNGRLLHIKNPTNKIIVTSSSCFNEELCLNLFSFNDKLVFNNLDLNFIVNYLFNDIFFNINVCKDYDSTVPLFIFNFYLNDEEYNSSFSRFLINIEDNVNINLFEGHFNFSDNIFVSSNTNLLLSNYSKVNYIFVNENNNKTIGSHSFHSKINEYSDLFYSNHVFNSKFYKSNFYINLIGKHSIFKSNFIRSLKLNNIDDIILKVNHLGNYSYSRSNFRGVASSFSKCSFYGFVDVNFDVVNIDAGLTCNGLTLDDSVNFNLIPELSIKNNDVKCFHSATVGFIDESVIFYIMSRGFLKSDCFNLLINAFLIDALYDDNVNFLNLFTFLFNKYYVY